MKLFLNKHDALFLAVLLVGILGGGLFVFLSKPQQERHEWAAADADSCRSSVSHGTHRSQYRRYSEKRRYRYDGDARHRAKSRSAGQEHTVWKSNKFRADTVLNLNTADTALLQRVPGIGAYRARRIVDYRSKLGGFVRVEQLDEIDSSLVHCHRWFSVSGSLCRHLDVNHAAFRTLLHHPYLNYEQVCQLMNYRRRQGSLSSLSTLLMLPAFSPADTLRLKPYLSFE